MAENKVWLPVNQGGSFVNEGARTKYVGGSLTMLHVRINHVSFFDFMEDIRTGLQCDEVTRVFYRAADEMGSFCLIYDNSSLGCFVDLFLNNNADEIFVEYDQSEVVDERFVALPLHGQQRDLTNEVDLDYHSEAESECSETDTNSSDEQDIVEMSNRRDLDESQVTNRVKEYVGGVGQSVGRLRDDDVDDTDYAKSDADLVELEESEEEKDNGALVSKHVRHNFPNFDIAGRVPVFAVGMIFDDLKQFKDAIDRHSILEKRGIYYQRNSYYYMRAKCLDRRCPWHITASVSSRLGELQVKAYEPTHVCQPVFKNKRATSIWLAEEFRDIITSAPTIEQGELKDIVKKQLGLNISVDKARRTRERVLVQLQCDYEKEYERLWDYMLELKKSNTTVVLDVTESAAGKKSYFKRIYVCFDACRQGFLAGCRRIIGVDGCFLKGLCKGQLLCAIGRDADNGMFPLAWAVVGVENEDNWKWFLGLLKSELGIVDMGEEWTFTSDRQKGLINAMTYIFPKSEHRFCARHLNSNWRSKHPAKRLNKIFWACVRSSNLADFRENMENLQVHSPAAFADLKEVDFHHWVKAYFRTDIKCDAIENNICESFNRKILKYRGKAIITMLEGIRNYVMRRMAKQRNEALKWARDCSPRALEKLEEARHHSHFCKVRFNGDHGFEIENRGEVYVVDVNGRSCTCGLWQLRGIPYAHGVSAIHYLDHDVENYVDSCYKKGAFVAAYQHSIPVVPSMRFWESSGLVGPAPPALRTRRGRRQQKRKKEPIEMMESKMSQKGQLQRCGRCGGEGHNKRGCKGVESSSLTVQERKRLRKEAAMQYVVPDKRKKRAPYGYGVYYDKETQQTILHPGTRSEIVLTLGEGSSNIHVASELGSKGNEMSGMRPLPSTLKGRPKQPVRRGQVPRGPACQEAQDSWCGEPAFVHLED